MTRLYVAGPMSSLPDFNYPAFYAAAKQLRTAGYEVENPAENVLASDRPADEPMWLGFMRMSLVQISKVDGLALLPGWSDSDGATLEHKIGTGLKLPVHSLPWWLRQTRPEPVLCPECSAGKPVNCAGQGLHPDRDEIVLCGSRR